MSAGFENNTAAIELGPTQLQVVEAGELSFAHGQVGQRYPLATPEARQWHAEQLALHTVELTHPHTADCGDERETIMLADGTIDPEVLERRIAPQLFGGLGLASTKAAVAANAAIVRGARTMQEAYERVSGRLAELGEEDGGHAGCGASFAVESSVAQPIPMEALVPSVGLFIPIDPRVESIIGDNAQVKAERLANGFYGGWAPNWHIDYLIGRFPHNFSHVAIDPDDHETHGHDGSSLYVVTQADHGFAKNAFTRRTGQAAFGLTLPKMYQVAGLLAETAEERTRIVVGFADDSLHVGGGIVTEGMPAFAEAAQV